MTVLKYGQGKWLRAQWETVQKLIIITPVTPRQPTRLTTTNAVGINRQEYV